MEDFANANGLDLRQEYIISDFGKSSFSKEEEQKELQEFLIRLKNDEFDKNDVFAIENIDRLTRRGPLDALAKINEIMLKMRIAILNDNEQKILQQIDIINLIQIAIGAEQANQESLKKSIRLNASWKNKRDLARSEKKPITRMIPAWISINDNNEFYLNDFSKTVKYIFELSLKEFGNIKIANILNNEKINPFPRNKFWTPSNIHKILASPATYGMYQPKKQNTGKRDLIEDGDPIFDYFPKVIDKNTYDKVQAFKVVNKKAGRKGENFTNIFTGLLVCAHCHSAMHMYNSGIDKRLKEPKSTNYLLCSRHKALKDCNKKRVRFEDLTLTILNGLKELDLSQIFDENNSIKKAFDRKKEIEGRIVNNNKIISNLENITIQLNGDVPLSIVKSARSAELEIENLNLELIKIDNELNAIDNVEQKFTELAIENMEYEHRLKLNNFLKSIIIDIEVLLSYEHMPTYLIKFKNGVSRLLYSDYKSDLKV